VDSWRDVHDGFRRALSGGGTGPPATVDGFWIDRYTVTNRDFARFVRKTGYVTLAKHPVVQVASEDAQAYAQWAGKELPTEAEWEFAARGRLDGAAYAWGEEFTPDGRHLANTWQGDFPLHNTRADGYEGTAPVGRYPANGYGLFDMIGNVWEWTADWYAEHHAPVHACCAVANPRGGERDGSLDPSIAGIRIPHRVMKGGSHLCAPNYCRRYRPAARMPQSVDTSTSHLGFRCIVRGSPPES
jgi:formylglycine-generating enzyme required for sulfatase activity